MKDLIIEISNQKNNFVAKSTGEEMMLVPLKNDVVELNQFLTLNEVGAFIWESIDGSDTLETLTEKVCAEFDGQNDEVRADISQFLQELKSYVNPS